MEGFIPCEQLFKHASGGAIVLCESDYGALQALGLAIAVVAIIVPILLFKLQNIANRRKATLDWIVGPESSSAFVEASRTFSGLRQSEGFDHLADPVDDEAKAQRRAVLVVLNHLEMTALHIDRGILDQRTYRSWMQSALVRDWRAARSFVERERWKEGEYRAAPFCELEKMILRWVPDVRPILPEEEPPSAPDAKSDHQVS